ncbi:hypothetical protein EMIT0324P_170004 [Pseudomonas chlororaphis]
MLYLNSGSMHIHQSTPNTVINWDSFNIDQRGWGELPGVDWGASEIARCWSTARCWWTNGAP